MGKFIIQFVQSLGFWGGEVEKEGRKGRFQSLLNSMPGPASKGQEVCGWECYNMWRREWVCDLFQWINLSYLLIWLYPRFCQNVTSEITISNIKFSVYIFPSSSSFAQVTPLQQFFDLVNPPIHYSPAPQIHLLCAYQFPPIFACSLYHLNFWIYYHYHSCKYLHLTRQYSRVLSTPPGGIQTSPYFHLCSSGLLEAITQLGRLMIMNLDQALKEDFCQKSSFSLWFPCSLKQLFLTFLTVFKSLPPTLCCWLCLILYCKDARPSDKNSLIFLWIFLLMEITFLFFP